MNEGDMCDIDKHERVRGDEMERQTECCGGVGRGVWLDGRPCNRLFSNVQLLIIPGVINHPGLTNELQQSGTPLQWPPDTHTTTILSIGMIPIHITVLSNVQGRKGFEVQSQAHLFKNTPKSCMELYKTSLFCPV